MGDCSCIYVGCGSDEIDFVNEKIVTARKVHKCGECHGAIAKGSSYENVSGSWSGDFHQYKTCTDCLSIRGVFFCDGWYYEMVHEYLRDHIKETKGEVPEDCLNTFSFLTPKAKEMVYEVIENVWSDLND